MLVEIITDVTTAAVVGGEASDVLCEVARAPPVVVVSVMVSCPSLSSSPIKKTPPASLPLILHSLVLPLQLLAQCWPDFAQGGL